MLFYSVDPFSKKDWYDVKAPAMFNIRNLGKTLVTRTQGTSKSAQCKRLILKCISNKMKRFVLPLHLVISQMLFAKATYKLHLDAK